MILLIAIIIIASMLGFLFGVFWASARIQRPINRTNDAQRLEQIIAGRHYGEHLFDLFARQSCMNASKKGDCSEIWPDVHKDWCYPCLARMELARIENVPVEISPPLKGDLGGCSTNPNDIQLINGDAASISPSPLLIHLKYLFLLMSLRRHRPPKADEEVSEI